MKIVRDEQDNCLSENNLSNLAISSGAFILQCMTKVTMKDPHLMDYFRYKSNESKYGADSANAKGALEIFKNHNLDESAEKAVEKVISSISIIAKIVTAAETIRDKNPLPPRLKDLSAKDAKEALDVLFFYAQENYSKHFTPENLKGSGLDEDVNFLHGAIGVYLKAAGKKVENGYFPKAAVGYKIEKNTLAEVLTSLNETFNEVLFQGKKFTLEGKESGMSVENDNSKINPKTSIPNKQIKLNVGSKKQGEGNDKDIDIDNVNNPKKGKIISLFGKR